MADPEFPEIEATLKRAAATLRDAGIPFILGGSLASWARGGPESRHDLDLMLRAEDAERAVTALKQAGMRREDPPEEWLTKAWDGDVLIDLIFAPKGVPVDDDLFARADTMAVLGMELQVMALEDLVVTKLLSITEQSIRYERLLQIARALREQIPWDRVRARTAESPFARAFFVLAEELRVIPSAQG